MKGFRTAPAPTKGEVLQENNDIKNQVAQHGAMLNALNKVALQQIQTIQQMKPELDAITSLLTAKEIDDVAKENDHVMIDYLGLLLKEDGSPAKANVNEKNELTEDENGELPYHFEGGYGSKFVLLGLGGGTLLPGFEDTIKGKKAGDVFDLELQFPTNYNNASVAGRKAKFKVAVRRVYRALQMSEVDLDRIKFDVRRSQLLQAAVKAKNETKEINAKGADVALVESNEAQVEASSAQ